MNIRQVVFWTPILFLRWLNDVLPSVPEDLAVGRSVRLLREQKARCGALGICSGPCESCEKWG